MFSKSGSLTVSFLKGLYLIFVNPFVWTFKKFYDRKAFGYSIGILGILLWLAFLIAVWIGGLIGIVNLSLNFEFWTIPLYPIWLILAINMSIVSNKIVEEFITWCDYKFGTKFDNF